MMAWLLMILTQKQAKKELSEVLQAHLLWLLTTTGLKIMSKIDSEPESTQTKDELMLSSIGCKPRRMPPLILIEVITMIMLMMTSLVRMQFLGSNSSDLEALCNTI